MTIFFFLINNNILLILYIAGIYLLLIGSYLLLNDADIYIGFLWVIDLGVGLVFFIFILHFTSFLHQKSNFNLTFRYFIIMYLFFIFSLIFFYYFGFTIDKYFYTDLKKIWFFKITYIDYYIIFFSNEITDLNTLRDTYFLLNTFEFFLVNFSLLFGLFASIFLCFIIHRIFNFLNYSQIININILNTVDSGYFIRVQDVSTQQNMRSSIKVWNKIKK